ncbi:MAG: DUF924 family protein [Hyphomicrobiaceae bacterium]
MNADAPDNLQLPETWAEDVLKFWFEELEPADWFKKSDETDATIRARYLNLYERLAQVSVDSLLDSSREALAAVIVLDQFPRNLFRGDPKSFATDAKARAITEAAIDAGFDQGMSVDEAVFLYLPFEHSEDLADQNRCVLLMEALGNENYTQYAIAHRDVIVRFGRFPHRNAILGRASTAEEDTYLVEPGSGF